MDILRLLEDLEDATVEQPKSMGPLYWNYNRDEIQMQIHKIRASLPLEMKQAANLTREGERVLDQAREDAGKTLDSARTEAEKVVQAAQAEAERILREAKLSQERMLDDNEILKLAKAQCDEIRAKADDESRAMRRGAEDYAYTVLSQLESVVGRVMTTVDRGKAEIRPATESAVVPMKEKVKLS